MEEMITFMLCVLLQFKKVVDISPLAKAWLNANHRLAMDIKIEPKLTKSIH